MSVMSGALETASIGVSRDTGCIGAENPAPDPRDIRPSRRPLPRSSPSVESGWPKPHPPRALCGADVPSSIGTSTAHGSARDGGDGPVIAALDRSSTDKTRYGAHHGQKLSGGVEKFLSHSSRSCSCSIPTPPPTPTHSRKRPCGSLTSINTISPPSPIPHPSISPIRMPLGYAVTISASHPNLFP